MFQEAALLSSVAVVAWLDREQRVTTNEVFKAVCKAMGTLPPVVNIVLHFPEQFLIHFIHLHHRTLAVRRGNTPLGDNHLQVSNIVDDELQSRDRQERISRPARHHRRDDEDDDRDIADHDRRGRETKRSRSRIWGENIRRSLSRAARHKDQRRDDHGRDDGGKSRDGRRYAVEPEQDANTPLFGPRPSREAIMRVLEHQATQATLPAAPLSETRERTAECASSPHAARRRSMENVTPAALPRLSSTTVLPPTMRSK
ncbi:hypothetical protein ZWY2020_025322 [Hordeum vulgare]|nr:hypothetical protein ZWY2020_025322 [Hordeum vulgare]